MARLVEFLPELREPIPDIQRARHQRLRGPPGDLQKVIQQVLSQTPMLADIFEDLWKRRFSEAVLIQLHGPSLVKQGANGVSNNAIAACGVMEGQKNIGRNRPLRVALPTSPAAQERSRSTRFGRRHKHRGGHRHGTTTANVGKATTASSPPSQGSPSSASAWPWRRSPHAHGHETVTAHAAAG